MARVHPARAGVAPEPAAVAMALVALLALYDAVLTRTDVIQATLGVLPDTWTDRAQPWWMRLLDAVLVA